MRGKWLIIILLAISGCSLLLFKNWQTSPGASLYYLGKAIYSHDPRLFSQYVDLEAIAAQLEPALRSQGRLGGILAGNSSGFKSKAEAMISEFIADARRPNISNPFSILLNAAMGRPEGGQVAVMISLSPSGIGDKAMLGFTLKLYPDEVWRVAGISEDDLEWLLLYCLGLI
ncbi:MAG: hypothetical protein LBJ14_01035 [Desulfarculales bacterium]|jgi:hypothetical protein|nr:hypothetical protein [Desulfarculales bacterium]